MNLRNVTVKSEYRTFLDDIVANFYVPVLSRATLYRRAVGFFSSSVLIRISQGIERLAANGGFVQIVASPHLSEDDVSAIRRGYERRDEIVCGAVLRGLTDPQNEFEKRQLNLLANLIANGTLDFKIAFTENEKQAGMYHEKMGLISDAEGNVVAFSGSLNETQTALSLNYEAIDVFCSWKDDGEAERVRNKESAFTAIWNGVEPNVRTIAFPELQDEMVRRYRTDDLLGMQYEGTELHGWEHGVLAETACQEYRCESAPVRIPPDVTLHNYQIEAIDNWKKNGFRGVFDMATGTGKTYTALGAIARLCDHLGGNLAIVIVCPFQHLVEQWAEDIRKFGIEPIIGHSASLQRDWLSRLDNAIRDRKIMLPGREAFCFVCANASFASAKVQNIIAKMRGNALLVVDEAHNFGATNLSRSMSSSFDFRLALSATIERHGDEEGTARLFDYFGAKCIEYDLERAISEKKLTPYKYIPVIVSLNFAECNEYARLTDEIKRCLRYENGASSLSEKGKRLALQRARLVAGAEEKINKLAEAIAPYADDTHILVYCGATRLSEESANYCDMDDDERRQISVVSDLLGNRLGMRCSHFTSREPMEERAHLKRRFEDGELQALVAIKCLDEGVNIPAIKTAFILASTTNPKEYIQRRGRVLRLSSGKERAEIYDFITLPCPLAEARNLMSERREALVGLVCRELERAENFASIAQNAASARCELIKIRDAFRIYTNTSQTEEQ